MGILNDGAAQRSHRDDQPGGLLRLTIMRALCLAAFSGSMATAAVAQPAAAQDKTVQAMRLQENQQRWDSLAAADRAAIQDSLVWLGLYNGVVDGAYGQRTSNAIAAFETREMLPPGAVISGPGLHVLRAAANREKTAAGFANVSDPATGIRIGVPSRLLDRRASAPGRTSLSSSRGPTTLTLFSGSLEDGDLPAWYARATAAGKPGRKITYKILRPEFAVVTGDDGPNRFFTRVAAEPDGLRGFTFVYPASEAARMDRLTIAIANSFAPFAGPPDQALAATGAGAQAGSAAQPAPEATGRLTGAALMIAPRRAVTAIAALRQCQNVRLNGAPATVLTRDSGSGLALLETSGDASGGLSGAIALGPLPAPDTPLTFVTFALASEGQAQLSAIPGSTGQAANKGDDRSADKAVVALQGGGPGSLALDQYGRLAGIVSDVAPAPRIGGVALAASHPLVAAERAAAFLRDGGAAIAPVADGQVAPLLTGEAVARWRARLAPVTCQASR